MVIQKRGFKRKETLKAYFLIVNIIIATFAFSWMVSGTIAKTINPTTTSPFKPEELFMKTEEGTAQWLGAADPNNPLGRQKGILENGNEVFWDNLDPNVVEEVAVSEVQKAYWGQTVKLANGQESVIADAIKDYGNFNDPELLKTLNAKSIYEEGGKTIIDQGEGAKIMIGKDGAITSTSKGSSAFSRLLRAPGGYAFDALLTGVQWAAGAYLLGQTIGSLAGMDKKQTAALSWALAGGSFTWQFFETVEKGPVYEFFKGIGTKTGLAGYGPLANPFTWGLGVSIVTFVLLYKKESKEIVTFSCKPWQAPVGGGDCEKCNKVEGCSDYKCRSLGQACQLLNSGTTEEKCTWVNPKDVSSPIISLWNEVLTKGYKYVPDTAVRPPARGFKIVKTSGDECVKAFTPLEFGITTNEPSQCRIDYNHTLKFDNMAFWFGESNLYLYNHTQKLSLPSPASIQAAAPELQHDGTYTLYIRCQDANGNANVDEFAMRFCVEKGPDTTPPKIEGTSIANNMPVKYNQTSVELEVYVNEPSECKWSREDRSYDNMENLMSCSKNVWEMNNNLVYTCKTTLTGVKDRTNNVFYFRCKDQPWLSGTSESSRNVNMQSYKFTLIGTEPLNIIDIKPNGTVKGSTDVVSVWLEVETANGYKNGEAKCYYSDTTNEADWIEFFDTGTSLHKQRLDLVAGSYKYYIKCIDLGGNRDDNSTTFKVEVDRQAPIIARVYRENELLKIITIENSECRYSTQSCNFKFEDGVDMPYANQKSHVAEWKTNTNYYIRCADKYGNMPISNTCSMIVRPYDVVESVIEL